MNELLAAAPSILASFLASLVEFVEALTIVLAVGTVRGWRPALLGTGSALAVLLALVAVLGPALTRIPLDIVQLVIGTMLLLFGLRWLRKAILRAAGVLALHDEAKAFEQETAQLRRRGPVSLRGIDPVAFGASFKIVMLEGIEVVFIVIAIGAGGTMLVPASLGAALALGAVVVLGLCLHKPLATIPENTFKFIVGVLLSAFGCFWVGEGLGLEWPGADTALLFLVAVFLAVALLLVPICRRLQSRATPSPGAKTGKQPRKALAVIVRELIGLFVDDGWLALGVLAWIVITRAAAPYMPATAKVAAAVFVAGLAAVLCASAMRRARS